MFSRIVPDGQRVLMTYADGRTTVIKGSAQVWDWNRQFQLLRSCVAHPGEYLVIRDLRRGRVRRPALL